MKRFDAGATITHLGLNTKVFASKRDHNLNIMLLVFIRMFIFTNIYQRGKKKAQ